MKKEYEKTQMDIDTGINRFLLDVYSSSAPTAKPKLIMITAGPGAGKTGIEMFYKRKLKDDGERGAIVNSDRIAEFHPDYEDALEELPEDCYKITRQFVRPATPIIFEALKKRNINIINENTLNKGQSDIELIRDFKEAGYKISINVIATDKYIARLSCYEREARDLEIGKTPRGISKKNQDSMYNGFVEEIHELDSLGLCDEINVYTRGKSVNQPKLVYQNGDPKYRDFYDAMVSERNRQRKELLKNPGEYLSKIEEIKKSIQINGVSKELTKNAVEGLEDLKQEFVNELNNELLKN